MCIPGPSPVGRAFLRASKSRWKGLEVAWDEREPLVGETVITMISPVKEHGLE